MVSAWRWRHWRRLGGIPSVRLSVCGVRTGFFEKMESARQRGLDSIVVILAFSLKEIVERLRIVTSGYPNHRNIFTEINMPTRIFEYLALLNR